MKFEFVPATVTILFLTACAEAPVPVEQQFVDNAVAALGGEENVAAASTLSMEGMGTMQNVGQDMTPESTDLKFTISDYTLTVDLSSGSSRTEQTRTPQFVYFRGPDPVRQIFGLDGEIAYDVGPDGTARRAPDTAATERRSTYYHHPLTLLRAASLGGVTAGPISTVHTLQCRVRKAASPRHRWYRRCGG